MSRIRFIEELKKAAAFNGKIKPLDVVKVKKKDGTMTVGLVLTRAWVLGGEKSVVLLTGATGLYSLDRVEKL